MTSGTPRKLSPPPHHARCPECPTRAGCSEVAWHIYGIEDAECERCKGTGFVPKPRELL